VESGVHGGGGLGVSLNVSDRNLVLWWADRLRRVVAGESVMRLFTKSERKTLRVQGIIRLDYPGGGRGGGCVVVLSDYGRLLLKEASGCV